MRLLKAVATLPDRNKVPEGMHLIVSTHFRSVDNLSGEMTVTSRAPIHHNPGDASAIGYEQSSYLYVFFPTTAASFIGHAVITDKGTRTVTALEGAFQAWCDRHENANWLMELGQVVVRRGLHKIEVWVDNIDFVPRFDPTNMTRKAHFIRI